MNVSSLKSKMLLAALSTIALTSTAQENESRGRFGLSYCAAFNISTDFSGVGSFSGKPGIAGTTSGAPGTIARQYDDGFIGVDNGGNAGNKTWFWGYNNASQVVGDTIQMHSTSSSSGSSSGVDDGPQHGAELSYTLPIGGGEKCKWGLESAFNWTGIGISDNRTLAGSLTTITHSFALGGVIPPPVPPAYVGTAAGPGPLISDVAVNVGTASSSGGSVITGNRNIDATLYGIRVGPYAECSLTERLSLQLGAGLSVGLIDSEFSFNETVTTSSSVLTSSGRSQENDFLAGGYIRGQLNWQLCKRSSLFAGAEFNYLGTFDQSAGGKNAQLKLDAPVYLNGGITFSF